jgi:predicted transcriptional regulator
MSVKALDSLLAIKIIGLMPDLRPSDRRVATLIIEHYNRRDGRCDPGIERLSSVLGLSRRTVFRSLKRLEVAGLIKRIRHGGYSHRNRYVPNWARLADLSRSWDERLKLAAKSRAADLSPFERHSSHVERDAGVTQTYKANLHNQTYRDSRGSTHAPVPTTPRKACLASPTSSGDAAAIAAERRWTNELQQRFGSKPITYGEIIEAIDPQMQAAATQAEIKCRGAGYDYIARQLKLGVARC